LAPPRITIVTPVLNRAGLLPAALESVALQGYPEVEHIVIDGGSTDGTLAVLRNAAAVQWISEPDRGPFDALNKGIRRATGDIIGRLDSDDILLPGALAAVAEGFARDRAAEAACGGVQLVRLGADGSTRPLKLPQGERLKRLADWRPPTLGDPIAGARFFRRSWFRRAGFYNPRYRLAADRDFLIRSLILGMRTVPLERVICQSRRHDGALTAVPAQRARLREECRSLARACLVRPDSPEELRRMACRWFAVETARRLKLLADRKSWHDFRATVRDAGDTLPSWPFWCLREGLHRLSWGLL
jgi:glycosyltransferase involved in cell wall biosynthesis